MGCQSRHSAIPGVDACCGDGCFDHIERVAVLGLQTHKDLGLGCVIELPLDPIQPVVHVVRPTLEEHPT